MKIGFKDFWIDINPISILTNSLNHYTIGVKIIL